MARVQLYCHAAKVELGFCILALQCPALSRRGNGGTVVTVYSQQSAKHKLSRGFAGLPPLGILEKYNLRLNLVAVFTKFTNLFY